MEINNISALLQKYAHVGLKDSQIKNSLLESIQEASGVEVDKDSIKISNSSIKIDVQGPEKAEIFINSDKIKQLFIEKVESLGYKFSDRKII
jgi:hypothetical protein